MLSASFSPESMPAFLTATLDGYLQALSNSNRQPQVARLSEVQRRYADQLDALWRGTTTTPPNKPPEPNLDPRFKSEEWQKEQYFDSLSQAYLTGAAFLHDLVSTIDADPRTRQQLQFATRQYTDAMSPANFLATNPEALALARETNGESILAGLKNLVADLTDGRIATSDQSAFEVGRNLATTPGAVVFENELIQLIQYSPTTEMVDSKPLLIVPPCINKFYVLDLQPENSFVRYAVDQGFTVFMVSWRSATSAIAHLTWDDYLDSGVLAAAEVVKTIRQVSSMHALGFCIGGTLLGCAAAVCRAREINQFASLTLLTTMLNFSDTGEIGLMVDSALVATREATIGKGGLLYGAELASVFSMLRANDLVWPYVVNNYLKGAAPAAFDILYWNADSTNLPGPMYCWYLRHAYLQNQLKAPGGTVQCGVPIDLSTIDMAVYVLATREDHIVPWTTAFQTSQLIGGDSRFVLGASGHIAGVINPAGRNKRCYWVDGEQGIGPQTWLRTAQELPGSWWTDWSKWLIGRSEKQVAAPSNLGSPEFPVIEPAPGRYVKTKAERSIAV
jgi:polyhydroxyalkanoate synthase subunit PhaC